MSFSLPITSLYEIMPLTKQCLKCDAIVNLRQSVCKCGNCFILKKKAACVNVNSRRKSKRIAMQSKRALETACETRKKPKVNHGNEKN